MPATRARMTAPSRRPRHGPDRVVARCASDAMRGVHRRWGRRSKGRRGASLNVLWRLVKFVRPYWWGSLVSIVLIFILTGFRLGPAWFTKLIIDEAVPAKDVGLALM